MLLERTSLLLHEFSLDGVIDFNGSYLTWLTKTQDSYGRFSIEAILNVSDKSRKEKTRYYLLSRVMAGNVFGIPPLIKLPPVYSFQAIFADNGKFKILRTYAGHSDDSIAHIETFFKKIDLHLEHRQLKALKNAGDIIEATLATENVGFPSEVAVLKADVNIFEVYG